MTNVHKHQLAYLLGWGWAFACSAAISASVAPEVPADLRCEAAQTAGFHDYPVRRQLLREQYQAEQGADAEFDQLTDGEIYEAVVFYESEFRLRTNRVLLRHLADTPYDSFLTLTDAEGEVVELQCVYLRGIDNAQGLSCTNSPPSELLLLNLQNLRFTRSSIGGWTFAGARFSDGDSAGDADGDSAGEEINAGDSIFVEYGRCAEG
ncbi:MAG: hypothetical protein AAF993_10745 [Pseudomonadota bacterium]